MKYLKNLARKIFIFLFRIPQQDEEPEKPRKRRKYTKHENVSFGQFTTIKSVLDSLDSLFADMKILQPKKKEFQALVKRYGPYICSLSTDHKYDETDSIKANGLDTGFKAYGLPTFLISYHDKRWYKWAETHGDERVSSFFVARKQKSLPFMHPKGNRCCYECCFVGLLDNEPIELVFNIVINKDSGEVEAYPYLAQIPRYGKGGRIVSHKMGLHYPDYTPEGKADIDHRKAFIIEQFCLHFNMVLTRENSINIIVKKGKDRATITVPSNRWKYFFKDRVKVKTSSGNTRPIFHAVSSHLREYKNGKVAPIKTHYRGLRSFRWDGYSIKIVMPGKHGAAQASLDLAGEIVDLEKIDSGDWVDMGSSITAEKINKTFEAY